MKKESVFLILFILFAILSIYLVSSQADDFPGKDSIINVSKIEQTKQNIEEQRWQYLSEEWKNRVLKNEYVAKTDDFLTKYTSLFKILFGEPYTFSFQLIVIIIFWIWFALYIAGLTRKGLRVPEFFSYLIGIAFSVIISQIQLFRFIVEKSFYIIFSREAWWMRLIVAVIILFILIFAEQILNYFSDMLGKHREKRDAERAKKQAKQATKKAEEAKKSFSDVAKEIAGIEKKQEDTEEDEAVRKKAREDLDTSDI